MKITTKIYHSDINEVYQEFLKDKPYIIGTDTETSGLDQRIDKPFLIVFGWLKLNEYLKSYSFYVTEENKELYKKMIFTPEIKYHFMWNLKFDMGMLKNINIDLYPLKNLYEGETIPWLLFNYYDKPTSLALKPFCEKYVKSDASLLKDAVNNEIKEMTKNIKLKRAKLLKEKTKWTDTKLTKYQNDIFLKDEIPKEVLEIWNQIKKENLLPSYMDISKDILEPYSVNDVVLMLLAVNNYFGRLINIKSPDYQLETVIRESRFAKVLSIWEKEGLLVDKNYLLKSRKILENLIKKWYNELWELLGKEIKVGQHQKILEWFHKNNTPLYSRKNKDIVTSQKDTFLYCIENLEKLNAKDEYKKQKTIRICKLIIKLKGLDKYYTTYLLPYLNKLIEINGKYYIFGSINSFGTRTGRVSSGWQQFPRVGVSNCFCNNGDVCFNKEHIIFEPRAMFISRYNNGYLGFLDYSQMELRVAAEQTLRINKPDSSWLNAYFNYDNVKDWKPRDIHADSARKIFDINEKENQQLFKELRAIAKTSNFAILYGGSANAINNRAYQGKNMKAAETFYSRFKQTYPGIIAFQDWCAEQVLHTGKIKNDLGRIYRWQNPTWKSTREAGSCMVQGVCADFVKERIVEVQDYLIETKSNIKVVNAVHDEIILDIPPNELDKLTKIKEIMEYQTIWKTPLICEVSLSKTNWASKEK